MESLEKNVEKQLIVRMFEPDMAALKQTAKQISAMQDVQLNLYGQAGEVLVVVTVHAIAAAAATEMSERIASLFEDALGASVYGRGKGSLAYFTAGELIENEALIAAADPKTGALLGEEFSHTKRGTSVFDFGDSSYGDSRVMAKIKATAAKNFEPGDNAQMAAARAAAASKCARAEFGVAIGGVGVEGKDVYLAVAYKGYVYLRRFSQKPDAGKRAALAALDITRRLLQKEEPSPATRVFKANTDFSWDAPVAKRKTGNKYLAPIIVLAVLLVALGIACWYFFTHFTLGSDVPDTVPASTSQSISQPAPAGSTSAASTPADSTQGEPADSTPASSQSQAPADANGAVHPFS